MVRKNNPLKTIRESKNFNTICENVPFSEHKNKIDGTYNNRCSKYVQKDHPQNHIGHEKEQISMIEVSNTVIQPRAMLKVDEHIN